MIPPATLAEMIAARADAEDPSVVVVEAVLLRAAFERLDDFLTWLDEHTASTHGGDPSCLAVLQMIGGVRHKLAREVRYVDAALERIEE